MSRVTRSRLVAPAAPMASTANSINIPSVMGVPSCVIVAAKRTSPLKMFFAVTPSMKLGANVTSLTLSTVGSKFSLPWMLAIPGSGTPLADSLRVVVSPTPTVLLSMLILAGAGDTCCVIIAPKSIEEITDTMKIRLFIAHLLEI